MHTGRREIVVYVSLLGVFFCAVSKVGWWYYAGRFTAAARKWKKYPVTLHMHICICIRYNNTYQYTCVCSHSMMVVHARDLGSFLYTAVFFFCCFLPPWWHKVFVLERKRRKKRRKEKKKHGAMSCDKLANFWKRRNRWGVNYNTNRGNHFASFVATFTFGNVNT